MLLIEYLKIRLGGIWDRIQRSAYYKGITSTGAPLNTTRSDQQFIRGQVWPKEASQPDDDPACLS